MKQNSYEMSFKVCQGAWNPFEHRILCSFEARKSFCSDAGDAVRIEEAYAKLLEQGDHEPEGRREVHESAQNNGLSH